MSPNRTISLLSVAILSALSSAAWAEKNWVASVYTSADYHNNITRSSNKKSDVVYAVGANINASARTERHNLSASYDVSKDYYNQNTFKDQTNLNGGLSLRSMLWGQRMYWVVNHSQTTTLTSARLNDTPDNRQESATFSTGPQLYFRPSDRDSLSYTALYSKTDLEESTANENYSISQNATWSRILSEVTNLDVTGNHTETRFDENKLNNYERDSATIGFSGQRPWFNYRFSVGGNRVRPNQGEDESGAIYTLNLSRTQKDVTYSLSASRELTDTVSASNITEDNLVLTDQGILITDTGTVSIIERTTFSGTISGVQLSNRITAEFNANRTQSKSKDEAGIDQTQDALGASFSYYLSEKMSCFASLRYTQTDFMEEPKRTDKTNTATLGWDYASQKGLGATVSLSREERSSDNAGSDYSVYSALATLRYSFGSL